MTNKNWKVAPNKGTIITDGGDLVASCFGSPARECEANARLIAAAPALLAACQKVAALENSTIDKGLLDAVFAAIVLARSVSELDPYCHNPRNTST